MVQITANSKNPTLNLEDVVPVKTGNEGFMPDSGKGDAKKTISNAVDDLKDTHLRRNPNCDKKQFSHQLKAFKSILAEIYNEHGYGKLAEFCRGVADNSRHNFSDDYFYLSVSERFCESMGAKNGASLIMFMQGKIGASIGDVNLIFSPKLLKDGKLKEEVIRALDEIGSWFKGNDDAVYLRSVAFSDLRFALGVQPNEDFSEKNKRTLLGALSDSRVQYSLEKIIPRHEFAVFDYFKIISYAGVESAEKYAGIIAKNNNKSSFGNVRYMEEGTFRSGLTIMSTKAVSAAQGGRTAEFEKLLSEMEKLVRDNNKPGK